MIDKTPLFKEEINNIHVPTEKLDAIITNTFQVNERKKKKSQRNKILYCVGAVAVSFVLLVSSAGFSPAMANIASMIPVIGSVFSESGDLGLETVNEQGLSQVIGTTMSVDETSITIDEIFYDDTRFTIGFSITSENAIRENYLNSGPEITINGKTVSYGSTYEEIEISPTQRTGILNIYSFDDLPEDFKLGLTFNGADGKNWDFSTAVGKLDAVENLVLNHLQESNGVELKVSDVKLSSAGLLFSYTVNYETELENGRIDFKVIDENGKELKSHSGTAIADLKNKNMTGTILVDPVDVDIKKLTITPYIVFSEGMSVEVDLKGNKTTKNVFKAYEETDIEFESFTVTLPK